MAHTPRYAMAWDRREQDRWRERVVRSAIESAAYWAEERHVGINNALILFSTISNLPDKIRPKTLSTANYIEKTLTTVDMSGVDAQLYDDFIKQYRWLILPELEWNWCLAKFLLNHPRGPQPDAALQLFTYVDTQRQDFFETGDDFFDIAAKVKLIKAARALQAGGRPRDAETLIKIGLRRYPEYFSSGVHVRKKTDVVAVTRMLSGNEIVQEEGRAKLFQDDFMRRNRETISRPILHQDSAEWWKRG